MCRKIIKNKKSKIIVFVGIGGVSMSALAFFLVNKGYFVAGFDDNDSEILKKLRSEGVEINNLSYIDRCAFAVVSSAVSDDNKIIKLLKSKNKKIVPRGQFLSKIVSSFPLSVGISGTHGKTTCTCMLAHILKADGKKFTAHIGGMDKEFGNMAIYGDEIFVSEVCEYKKNIRNISCDISIILNVDNDHIDSYSSLESLKEEFNSFAHRSKKTIVSAEDDFLNTFDCIKCSSKNSHCGYYASDIKVFKNYIEYVVNRPIGSHFKVKVNSIFHHDIINSLCAIACATELNVSEEAIIKGLEEFKGIKRRNEVMGWVYTTLFYGDYAHHPTEIKDTLKILEQKHGKVAILFQPHTFSRTKNLINDFIKCFENTKNLYIFDTYGAREKYDFLGSGENLSNQLPNSTYCGKVENCEKLLIEIQKKFDCIAVLGAGDLYFKVKEFIEKFD